MLRVRSFAAGGAPSSATRARLTGLRSLDTSLPKHQSKLATDCGAAHDIVVVATSTKPSSNSAPAMVSATYADHTDSSDQCIYLVSSEEWWRRVVRTCGGGLQHIHR